MAIIETFPKKGGVDTTVYKPSGNKTCAQLTASLLVEVNLGNVYNITDNGTTTSDFIEGAGKPIKLGDNVAVANIGTDINPDYKFDLLSGFVDLSTYYSSDDTAFTNIVDEDYIPVYDTSANVKKKTLFSNLFDKLKTMTGATASVAGTKGLVPAPGVGDTEKYLKGNGTWAIPATIGFTPVGTVISVMGNSAPQNYLACNGTVYNIADYPELATYFTEQFGSVNYFGGNGTTTFAVPDLRGEFLRGAGTNSHTGQGSGANVGIHQDATRQIKIFTGTSTGLPITYGKGLSAANYDSLAGERTTKYYYSQTSSEGTVEANDPYFTARPTNTSVLFCIATKNIYINPSTTYSTSEQVIGTWVDGKPLYQKTIIGNAFVDIVDGTEKGFEYVTGLGSEIDTIMIEKIDVVFANKLYGTPIPTIWANGKYARCATGGIASTRNIYIYTNHSSLNGSTPYITIRYTKI